MLFHFTYQLLDVKFALPSNVSVMLALSGTLTSAAWVQSGMVPIEKLR